MKRSHLHVAFGLTALAVGLLAGYNSVRLHRAEQINAGIASASVVGGELPEAVLARAVTLSVTGQFEAAMNTYKELTRGDRADIRRIALYNLGNLYLRQALTGSRDGTLDSLPLIELAKQSYRDLLRDDPGDWDARYNLERALWLAPEVTEGGDEANAPPEWERRTLRGMPDFRIELP